MLASKRSLIQIGQLLKRNCKLKVKFLSFAFAIIKYAYNIFN